MSSSSPGSADHLLSYARLAAAHTLGHQDALATILRDARGAGISWDECYEALLQLVAYTGYPRTLNALATFRAVSGIAAPVTPSESWHVYATSVWPERGAEVFRLLWPGHELADSVRPLSPELAEWVINDDFGRIFGRPGLTLLEREAVVLGSLVAQAVAPQMRSHRLAFLAVGGTDEQIDALLDGLADLLSPETRAFAHDTVAHLRTE